MNKIFKHIFICTGIIVFTACGGGSAATNETNVQHSNGNGISTDNNNTKNNEVNKATSIRVKKQDKIKVMIFMVMK